CQRLLLDSCIEPSCVDTEAVDPVPGRYQGLDQLFQSEVAEKLLDVLGPTVNFPPNHLSSGFAREVQTALFVENRKGGTNTDMKPMLPQENPAETMKRRDGRPGQNRQNLDPWLTVLRINRRSNAITHFGSRLFRKGYGNDAKRICPRCEQIEI